MKMKQVLLEKVTVNICLGNEQEKINKAMNLLKAITGVKSVKTVAKKRIPTFDIRPGLPIGCKVTLRREKAKAILIRLLEAIDNTLNKSQFDGYGNFGFGIDEYIKIPDAKYDVEIGVVGLEVAVTLKRPGYRVKYRRTKTSRTPIKHRVTKQEAIDFMKKEFNVKLEEENEL